MSRKSTRCRETGKKIYGDKEQALHALRLMQKHRTEDNPLAKRIYVCDHCHGYHLTSMETYHGETDTVESTKPPKLQKKIKRENKPRQRDFRDSLGVQGDGVQVPEESRTIR